MSARVQLAPPDGHRFLPEGLQMLRHQGKTVLAGVCIQVRSV